MPFFRKLNASYFIAFLLGLFKYAKIGNDKQIEVRDAGAKGQGLFTTCFRKKGELVFIATGPAVHAHFTDDTLHNFPDWYSVDRDIWIDIQYPYVKINHSCEPNTGIDRTRCFVALRDIAAGEELTFDYSISDDEIGWQMTSECHCGSKLCEKVIGPIQTMTPERYARSFPYIPKHFQKVYRENLHLP